jgi:hypothetical protein
MCVGEGLLEGGIRHSSLEELRVILEEPRAILV